MHGIGKETSEHWRMEYLDMALHRSLRLRPPQLRASSDLVCFCLLLTRLWDCIEWAIAIGLATEHAGGLHYNA
jgi:hypothetical protein